MIQRLADDKLPLLSVPIGVATIVVTALGCFCFQSSLSGEFVFDDKEAILNNKDLLPESTLTDLFNHDFWGEDIKSSRSHKSYRPLTVLTFRLSCSFAGGCRPWGFHLVNVLLHGLNCLLVLITFAILLPSSDHSAHSSPFYSRYTSKAALLGGFLFATHPIHTESVAGIVGRADLLSCTFFLLAFLFYHYSLEKAIGKDANVRMIACSIFTAFLAGISMFCKEQGSTILGVCIIYDIIFTYGSIRLKMKECKLSLKGLNVEDLSNLRGMCLRVVTLFLGGISLMVFRLYLMNYTAPSFQPSDNPAAFCPSRITRILSYNYIYSINFWLLLNPWWLCFDWSMGCVPLINGLTDLRIFFPLTMWAFLISLTVKGCTFFTKMSAVGRYIILSLAFMIIPFLPASNLLFTVGFVVAERVLYLPSIGFCLLVVVGVTRIQTNERFQTITQILCIFLIAFFMARSIQRSSDWLNEESLFTSGLAVCPLNAKVHYNVGKVLADKGDAKRAVDYYLSSTRLNPKYDQPLNNLGNLLKDMGKTDEAEMYLERAVNVSPSFAAAWMNLGIVKADLKKFKEAENCYLKALKYRSPYPDAHFNLGNLYLLTQNHEAALREFDATLRLRPEHGSAWNNKILLLGNLGRLEEAVQTGNEAVKYVPNHSSLYHSVGNLLGQSGKYEDSERYLLKAIEMNPQEPSYYGNLGVVYHRWRKYKAAERYYQRSLELDPDNHLYHENYSKLKRALSKT